MKSQCLLYGFLIVVAAPAAGQNVTYDHPTFDRWNYPFNTSVPLGSREAATTFSSGLIPGMFDDRDAQFLNSFVTAGDITPGLGASNYIITSATATATLIGGEFFYDNVYHEGGSIDLFGTGFRNGLNAFAYGDDFAWGFGDPTSEDLRNAYATDNLGGSRRDVSNNVRDGFTPTPFAVGTIIGETPGSTVTGSGQTVEFNLDLSNPDVVSYLQDSLDLGIVSLSVTSLHVAQQGGPLVFPVFGTNEGGNPMTLNLSVTVVPAPASLAVLGFAGVCTSRRRN
ncbi:MAG TPA: hypothetical protein ENJ00_05015 [Phycisphaerales bacterium]|nr:hypothetical protein [Phycisphaerales bacterium]